MDGSVLGPYRVVRELGTGGMGSVYLAEAAEPAAGLPAGARVAVKVVHPHLIEQRGFFKRFLREAEIGRQVRHENVVRTLDVDAAFHDGRQVNFLVMEYVDGRSLRALAEEMGTVPEALLREIAVQAVAGLEAIHAAGVVHRDLKPENLLITEDQSVRIMDLGVAHLQEASVALTREGQFAGSFPYAAPEQFKGGEVGHSSDLYSLGVLIYELATGGNPFAHDTAAAVIQAHLTTQPPRASERNEEISPFLAEVLATLMEKEPEGRFASATELRSVLDEAEESEWWAAREAEVRKRTSALPRIPVDRETLLVGRDKEMAALAEAFAQARAGRGGTFLIEGDAGLGRTRLVDAFLHQLGTADVHVLYGSYPPTGGLGGISDAVLGKLGTAGLEEALRPYLTVTPALVPAFAAMLRHEPPPTGSEPLSGDAVHAVFVHLMRALAKEKPVIWVVEDLHFAPAESRKILLSLARAVTGHRVLLLLTSRPGLTEEEIGHFGRIGNFGRATLGRLSPREVMEMLREALRSKLLAERLGGKVAYKSDGVPYFVFEILRGLKEGKFIGKGPDGAYVETKVVSDIEVPSEVRDLVLSRLRDLSKDERALVDVGAVEGFAFTPALVARVLEEKKVRVLQDLAEIERRTSLVHSEGRSYRFDGHQVHDIVYEDLSLDLREEYHAMLAEAFADREGVEDKDPKDVPGPKAVFLAHHHLRGSQARDGVAYLVPAVDHLRKAYRDDEALDLVERALGAEDLLSGADRLETLLRAGPLLQVSGRPDEGTAALEEAAALADASGEALLRARAGLALAGHLQQLGHFLPALEVVETALPLAVEAASVEDEMDLESAAGGCLYRLGRFPEARARLESLLEHARAAGDVQREASASASLGSVWSDSGHHEEARIEKHKALAFAVKAGDRRRVATHTCALAEEDRAGGDLGVASELYLESMHLARETGHRGLESICRHNLGETLTVLGDFAGAREHLEAARAQAAEIGLRWISGYASRASADRAMTLGEAAGAAALYGEALEVARDIKSAALEAEALVGLGRQHALESRSDDAAQRLAAALDVARRGDAPSDIALATCIAAALPGGDAVAAAKTLGDLGDRPWHTARMECRWWLWNATQDTAHLAESWRLLQHLRDNAPEEYRDSVMNNVPFHRDIAGAAREAGL